ncbi:MAG: flagellar hook-length control protein FliK [Lachnospiraceae bacterium]|nr:flagellar hook-length control protein FliK [Lachnospiraceae bacterium]
MKEINLVAMGSQNDIMTQKLSPKVSKSSDGFENFMNNAAQSKSNVESFNQTKSSKDSTEIKNADTSFDNQQTVDKVSRIAQSKTDTDQSVKEVDMETVSEANEIIAQKVEEVLNIDSETLENIMAVLGLTFTDLLDPMNLQKLVLFVNGVSEPSELLTNEEMLAQFGDLTDAIAQIDWESATGMSMEEFSTALEQFELSQGTSDIDVQGENLDVKEDLTKTTDIPVIVEENVDDTQSKYNEDAAKSEKAFGETVNTNETETSDKKAVSQDLADKPVVSDKGSDEQTLNSQSDNEENKFIMTESDQETLLAKEERPVTNTIDFIQNLNNAVNGAVKTEPMQQSNMQQMINIVNQVVEQIKVTLGKDTTSMQLQLNPENLGKVLISVSSVNGVMTANFTVQSEEAREALQSQMYTLREALESKELKVEAVEVEVSDFAFSENNQFGTEDQKQFEKGNGKTFKFDFDKEESEETAEDGKTSGRTVRRLDAGTSIDFTA